MATLHKEIVIEARPESVWDAVRDVGALHTRLVPGFVVDTKLEETSGSSPSAMGWSPVNRSSRLTINAGGSLGP